MEGEEGVGGEVGQDHFSRQLCGPGVSKVWDGSFRSGQGYGCVVNNHHGARSIGSRKTEIGASCQ